MNLHVENVERCECVFHQGQMWVKLELALCLLLLMILQLYHLPPSLPSPVSSTSCLFTHCQPLNDSCCAVLLCFSRYCTVSLEMFSILFLSVFMYYLCEKHCKAITVQYHIADCVSWVPRLLCQI